MYWIQKTATQQRAALQRGEITALELLNENIAQLESMAPYLNPVSARLYDQAREAALLADKKLARPEVPVGCSLLVDGPPQIKPLDNAFRR